MIEQLQPNELSLTDGQIEQLTAETDGLKAQRTLNDIFTQERRAQIVDGASVDAKGRKVRYYRYMKWDKLLKMLKEGNQTSLSYAGDPDGPIDQEAREKLCWFCVETWSTDNDPDEVKIWDELRTLARDNDLSQLLERTFPNAPAQEKTFLLENCTYRNIAEFMHRYCSFETLQYARSGSLYQEFTKFLGVSAGGVLHVDGIGIGERDRVYVELVLPDDAITNMTYRLEGEKEVFVEDIPIDAVTRVFTTCDQIIEEVVENSDTQIGQYLQNSESDNMILGQIERWRWDEKTDDCLPVGVVGSQIELQKNEAVIEARDILDSSEE